MLLLGLDGGGTKTAAVVADEELRILGRGQSKPSNFLRVGQENAVRAILDAMDQACSEAGVEVSHLTAIGAGLAGVGQAIHHRRMRDALLAALNARSAQQSGEAAASRWGPQNFLLTTDAEIALAGATDCQPGLVIISGTGSIAYGMNAQGQRARSGGWGPTFGDEGSGYDIARRALSAVVSSFDGRLQPTVLSERICRYFGIETPAELPPVIYDNEKAINIAALSEVVIEAAREGDAIARAILREAGVELARAVVAVIGRLHMQRDEFRVAYVGGVFSAGDLILRPIRERVAQVAPRAIVAPPLFPPAIGAIKLTMMKLGLHSCSESLEERGRKPVARVK